MGKYEIYQNGGTPADVKKFYTDYINSPNYKKRLTTQGYTTPVETGKERLKQVLGTKVVDIPKNVNVPIDTQFIPKINQIDVNLNQIKGLPYNSTVSHEFGHAAGALESFNTDNPNLRLNNNEINEFKSRNIYKDTEPFSPGYSFDTSAYIQHEKKPSENKADLDMLRYKLWKDKIYDTGKQEFNQNILNKVKTKYSTDPNFKRFFGEFKDKDLIYLMNNVADNQDNQEMSDEPQEAKYGGSYQNGGSNLFQTNKTAYVDSTLNANKNLDWVQRLYQKNTPTIQVPGQPHPSTHFMGDDGNGYVFPTVVNINGQLQYIGNNAEDYARQTNTGIQLPKKEGTWFANNGYKKGTGVLNGFQNGGENPSQYADTSIFDLISKYAQQPQPQQEDEQDEPEEKEAPQEADNNYASNDDFKALQARYDELEKKVTNISAANYDGDDNFLNFLFDEKSNNDPIDFSKYQRQQNNSSSQTYYPQSGNGQAPVQSVRATNNGFQTFDTPQQGRAALEHQLELYKTGKTRNNVNPNSTLLEAMSVYAPAKDHNNPTAYANFIAKQIGVSPNTPISQINTHDWADAVTKMEGNKSGNNPGNLRYQFGGQQDVSSQGYNHDSPYKDSPYLDIHSPTGEITMENTHIPLIGIDNLGNKKHMKPGGKYTFPGTVIREIR